MENLKFATILERGNLTLLKGEIKEEYKRIIVALKEAWDFSGLPIDNLKVFFNSELLVFIRKRGEKILVILGEASVDIEKVEKELDEKLKELFKEEEIKEVKVEEKEELKREKVVIEEVIKREEVAEKIVDEATFDKVFEITVRHLSVFGEMVFENVLKEMRIDKKNCTQRIFKRFVKKIEESAQMIVGPTKAKEMLSEISKLLE
ncbi:MAG: hypothetical protein ABDH49_07700 [Candidatus Hydrothermales bacterium]